MSLWIALVAFGLVTSVASILFGFKDLKSLQKRVDGLTGAGGPIPPRELLLQRSFFERIVLPAVGLAAKMGLRLTSAAQRQRTQQKLEQAGLHGPSALQLILSAKALFLAAGGAVGALVVPHNSRLGIGAGAALMLLGIFGPDRWLEAKLAKRRAAITRALPDTLDLITAGTEAGLSFDAAIQRIAARPGEHDRALKEELSRYLADLRLGRSRGEALMELGNNCGIDDMKGLVAALMQADQLGVGVGNALRTQSLHLRTRRRQRAQEAAMKAPVKMMIPIILLIFPAMFVVMLGPAGLRLVDQLMNHS